MADQEIKKLTCPSCNAPLKISGDAPTMTCSYCNASVKIPREYKPIKPYAPNPSYPIGGHWYTNLRFIASVAIIAVIAIGRIAAGCGSKSYQYKNYSSFSSKNSYSSENDSPWALQGDVFLKDQEGSSEVWYGFIEDKSTQEVHIGKIVREGQKTKLAWSSAPLPVKKAFNIPLIKEGASLFVVAGTQLVSIDSKSGKTGFNQTLTDKIQCDTCLVAQAPFVSVATKDKNLQTFNMTTGTLVWQTDLKEAANKLYLIKGQIGAQVTYDKNMHDSGYLQFYQMTSGQKSTLLLPKGSKDPFGDPETLDSSSGILQDKKHPEIFYFVMGGITNRYVDIQKWNAETNSRLWERHLDISLKPDSYKEMLILSDKHFFMTNKHQITAFDVTDGSIIEIRACENTASKKTFESGSASRIGIVGESLSLYPLFEKDDTLYAEVHNDKGTKQIEIQSIPLKKDRPQRVLKTIVPKWSFFTTNAQTQSRLIDKHHILHPEIGMAVWEVSGNKIYLASVEDDGKEGEEHKVLLYSIIDLSNGNTVKTTKQELPSFANILAISADYVIIHKGYGGPQVTWLPFSSKDVINWP